MRPRHPQELGCLGQSEDFHSAVLVVFHSLGRISTALQNWGFCETLRGTRPRAKGRGIPFTTGSTHQGRNTTGPAWMGDPKVGTNLEREAFLQIVGEVGRLEDHYDDLGTH